MRVRALLIVIGLLVLALPLPAARAGEDKRPKNPAQVLVSVSPARVAPGAEVQVRVQVEPTAGIKINRYPKIQLTVPEQAGLTAGAQASTGNDGPPPPGADPQSNYFDTVDPVEVELRLDTSIARGEHELEGWLVYAYCVTASGFCTRTKVPVSIRVSVDPS